MNSLKHGFGSEALLMPGERREDYEATLSSWLVSLRPATPAEGRLVAQVADLDFRLERLARIERAQLLASADELVAKSATAFQLRRLRDLDQAIGGLVRMVSEILPASSPTCVQEIIQPLKNMIDVLIEVHLPGPGTRRLYAAYRGLCGQDREVEQFTSYWEELGRAGEAVQGEVRRKITEHEEALAKERDEVLGTLLGADDRRARLLDRHRAELQKQMDRVLGTLRTTRELAASSTQNPQPSSGQPLLVELRVVPTAARHARLSTAARR